MEQVTRISILAVIVCSCCSAQVKLYGYEQPPNRSFVGGNFSGEAWGDVDGDGDIDGVVADGLGPRLLLNDGTGALTVSPNVIPKHSPSDGYGHHRGIALVDLDSDKDLDLVLGSSVGASTPVMRFWENDGKGVFSTRTSFKVINLSAGSHTTAFDVADLDGDGDQDIVVAGYRFLWNDGSGAFLQLDRIPNPPQNWISTVRIRDVNGDGRPDLFMGGGGWNSDIWLDDGKGGYTRFWTSPVQNVLDAHLADLDGNGTVDLVIRDGYSWSLELFLNTGITMQHTRRLGIHPAQSGSFSIGDVDQDGDLDIVTLDISGAGMVVLENDGKGSFKDATSALVDAPNWPAAEGMVYGTLLADLDGDGDLDVGGLYRFLGPSYGHAAIVLRNRLRHLESPPTVALARNLDVGLVANHGHSMLLAVSAAEIRIPILDWGVLRLHPGTMMLLANMRLNNRVAGRWNVPVPNDPSLPGAVLRFQGLDVPGPRLTGLSRTRIVK